jgi:16S rRNA (cytidine1402-2'-O)-methyltransferase
MPGTLFVVATPIGNLEDITARALRVLRESALIAAEDTRRTAHLLSRYAITTPSTSLHEHNEVKKSPMLIERLKSGDDIALVSDAGTPTVSDPGARLIRMARDAGIRIEPVPGPSAALAALTVSGLASDTFMFMGFPPTKTKSRAVWLKTVKDAGRPVVFFEAPHRIRRTLRDILESVGDCPVTIGREMTKAHEELVVGPISAVLPKLVEPKGEFTVVLDIGHMTNTTPAEPVDLGSLGLEFGVMTDIGGSSRRQRVAELARRYGVSPNAVYAAIEKAKKSGI